MDRRDLRSISLDQFRPPNVPVRAILAGLAVLVLAILAFTSFYTIEPEEVGVVIRFGEYVRQAGPGLHFKLPAPLESVRRVPVQRQLKEEFGFRTETAGVRTRYAQRDFKRESLMLTGDLNVADVEWITQFRISEPYDFLFKVRHLRETFRDMNEAVMREVIGDRSVNEVLTVGRQEIAVEVEQRLQQLCDQYETGIRVIQVVLQDVNPPDPVKPSFNEVNQAQQERERMINEAMSEFNRVIPRARGEAQQTIEAAEGYATERVNRAKGDTALFESILAAFEQAPEVTRRRMYLETLIDIYPNVKRKVIIDSEAKNVLPLLNLDEVK